MKIRTVSIVGALLMSALTPISMASATGEQIITREVTVPAPPAAAFAGSSGGDGFDVSLVNGRIYNVFHHNASQFQVACLDETTGSTCDAGSPSPWPKLLTDSNYSGVGSPGQSWTFVSPDKTKLYGWAQVAGQHGGIMCMSLTSDSATANPSCGYTVLTANADETSTVYAWSGGYQDWGSNARVGNKVYATFSSNSGTKLWLACFDLSTGAQCSGAPYLVPEISGVQRNGQRTIAVGGRIYITTPGNGTLMLTCWDPTLSGECASGAGQWPRQIASGNYSGTTGIPNSNGQVGGVCNMNGMGTTCFNAITGDTTTVPTALTSFYPDGWWGGTSMVGARLVIPDSNNRVHCVDFAVSPATACAGSPFFPTNLNLLYSATPDPLRAGCFWLNADNGTKQIQNFDIFTMTAGCSGSQRVSTSQFVPDLEGCPVLSWYDLQVTDPAAWDTATVSISTPGGTTLSGGFELPMSPSVPTSLTGVTFGTVTNPTFSFAFTGATIAATGLKVTFRFLTDGALTCTVPGDVTKPAIEAPEAPTALTAKEGNKKVKLSWTAPAEDASKPVVGYEVQVNTVGAAPSEGAWTAGTRGCSPALTSVSTATDCDITGLSNGTTYWFRVRAVNGAGASPWSSVVQLGTPTFPGKK